ncbi:hypothetical protein LINPERHAP2_LOCUS15968 [Linum perenne]
MERSRDVLKLSGRTMVVSRSRTSPMLSS